MARIFYSANSQPKPLKPGDFVQMPPLQNGLAETYVWLIMAVTSTHILLLSSTMHKNYGIKEHGVRLVTV